MKFRTTIILLILVIGLGAFLLIYTAKQPSESTVKEEQGRLYTSSEFLEPGATGQGGLSDLATKLELRHGNDVIEVARPAEGLRREWRIVKPLDVPADSGVVTALLGEIEFLKVTRRLTPEKGQPLDLKSYGLEPPERSITFGIGAKSWTVNVGAKTPDGQSAYVARADAKKPVACVVPASILDKASERVNDLRDKTALRFDKAAVTRVDLVPAGGTALTVSKDATGWRLTGAIQDQADADSVGCLLDALAALRVDADDFIADQPNVIYVDGGVKWVDYGLDKPRFRLAILEGNTSRALLLGDDVKGHADKCYAMREDDSSIFALDKQAADGLMKTASDLRSRIALKFNPDEVTAITITPAVSLVGEQAPSVRLVRPKDQWKMEAPAGVTADPEQAVQFLNDLHNLEVTGWVDNPPPERLAECGLTLPPRMTVALQTKPDAAPVVILFGKPADKPAANWAGKPDTCYARRGEQGPILVVPAELPTRLAVGHLLFVSRIMLEFNKDDAVAVRIVRPEGVVALEQRTGRWRVVEPAPGLPALASAAAGEANLPRVENLLYGLAYLDAKRIEAEKPHSLAAYGLDAPRIQVTVSLKSAAAPAAAGEPAPPPALKTVLIGKELPGGDTYAMIAGGQRVFVLKGTTVNLFLVDFAKANKPDAAKESP